MKSLQFYKESFVYIHPVTKIVAFLFSSFLMMTSGETTIENIVIGIMLLLILNTKEYRGFRNFAMASCIFIGLDLAVYIFDLPIVFFGISKIGKMFLPTLMGFFLLSKKTSSLEFMAAFNSLKVPRGLQVPFVVMIRFIPTVQEALKDVRKALLIRGFTKKVLVKNPMMAMEYLIVPTLMSCTRSMDELASAAICRGFNHEKERTYLLTLKFGLINALVIFAYVGILLVKKVIM